MKADLFGIAGALFLLAVGLIIAGVLVYQDQPFYMSTPGLVWGGMVIVWVVLSGIIRIARKRERG